MNWQEVLPNIEIKSDWKGLYQDIIEDIYKGSTHMKEAIDSWISGGNKIYVDELSSGPSASVGLGKIHIPFEWFEKNDNAAYFSEDGTLHKYKYEAVFSHELMHAIKGTSDTNFQDYFDWSGSNVTATNPVWIDLGIVPQKSYPGTIDVDNEFQLNISYSEGNIVDKIAVAGTLSDGSDVPLNLGKWGNSSDLIIGSSQDEVLVGGGGLDFLYGRDGQDQLAGDIVGEDKDTAAGFRIYNDGFSDLLNGGEGHDLYGVGGHLGKVYTYSSDFKTISPNGAAISQADRIVDSDGKGEIWTEKARMIETNLGISEALKFVLGESSEIFAKNNFQPLAGVIAFQAKQGPISVFATKHDGQLDLIVASTYEDRYMPEVDYIISNYKQGDFGMAFTGMTVEEAEWMFA